MENPKLRPGREYLLEARSNLAAYEERVRESSTLAMNVTHLTEAESYLKLAEQEGIPKSEISHLREIINDYHNALEQGREEVFQLAKSRTGKF